MMIPICLVTGFLGSGKTTFLKQVAANKRQGRLVFLVNDFSAYDVDGARMLEETPDVVAVPGGSIFCRCLVGDFLRHLKEIPAHFQNPAQPIAGLVIEASGVADPRVMRSMLVETKLDRLYRLATIVAIVDPISFGKLLHTLPNLNAQIEAADYVLVNKIDLCDETAVATTCETVRRLNPRCAVMRTTHARANLDLFGRNAAAVSTGAYAPCKDPHYDSLTVGFHEPIDEALLVAALTSLGDAVYRAKGFIPSPTGLKSFDFAFGGKAEMYPIDREGEMALAVIVAGGAKERAREILAKVPGVVVEG